MSDEVVNVPFLLSFLLSRKVLAHRQSSTVSNTSITIIRLLLNLFTLALEWAAADKVLLSSEQENDNCEK